MFTPEPRVRRLQKGTHTASTTGALYSPPARTRARALRRSEDLDRVQQHVAAHLQHAHARQRHPVAEVVVVAVPDHHLRDKGHSKTSGAVAGCVARCAQFPGAEMGPLCSVTRDRVTAAGQMAELGARATLSARALAQGARPGPVTARDFPSVLGRTSFRGPPPCPPLKRD